MKRLNKTLMSIAALATVAAVSSLLAPTDLVAQLRAAIVRDADQPARQAVTLKHFSAANAFVQLYTVPAGRVLVVEHMNCSALTDDFYGAIFDGPLAHANSRCSVPVQSTSATVLIADGSTRQYFEAGSVLYLRMFTMDPGSMTCTVSGYTLDAV